MIRIHPSDSRGRTQIGWLDSRHSFSFGHYHNPDAMGFGPLRVINEDRVIPGAGFGTHPHRDMEILSYVVGGALEHKDSLGTGSVIRPGELQRMSAGTGVTHSEFNHSKTDEVHFLQIWILPEKTGIAPSYEQKSFLHAQPGQLVLIASRDGREDSVSLHRDVDLYRAVLQDGNAVDHAPDAGRLVWVQVVKGLVRISEETLRAGDGLSVEDESALRLTAETDAEILLFDMAP